MLPKVPKLPPPPPPFVTSPQVTLALICIPGVPCTFHTQAVAAPTVIKAPLGLPQELVLPVAYTGTVTFQQNPLGLLASGTFLALKRSIKSFDGPGWSNAGAMLPPLYSRVVCPAVIWGVVYVGGLGIRPVRMGSLIVEAFALFSRNACQPAQ